MTKRLSGSVENKVVANNNNNGIEINWNFIWPFLTKAGFRSSGKKWTMKNSPTGCQDKTLP
jgi:hypothetical protein